MITKKRKYILFHDTMNPSRDATLIMLFAHQRL